MVKFSDNDRDGYEKVRDVVQELVKNAGTVIKARIQENFNDGIRFCFSPDTRD